MVLKFICIILIVVAISIIVNAIEEKRKRNRSKISFREAIDLSGLPVVTFYNNSEKVNFLLDTGSDSSYINKAVLNRLKYRITEDNKEVHTAGGVNDVSFGCIMDINYKGINFTEEFGVLDLQESFNAVKQDSGVNIDGILGSKFFQDFKYVLDYDEMTFYTKR